MTPGHPDEPRRSEPGQRALGAMESAVHRARASQGTPSPPGGSSPPPRPPVVVPSNQPQRPGFDDYGAGREPARWLATAVVIVAVLVVASGIALAVSTSHGSGRPSPTATPTTHPGRTGASQATHGAGPSTTTATAPSIPGSPPQISSLTPASGSPGQTLTVTGSNFLSSDGSIVASFDGQVTATSCSSEAVCTVTVPPQSAGETSAQVTISTASGTSNAVAFSYT
jgi:hypothetical protein